MLLLLNGFSNSSAVQFKSVVLFRYFEIFIALNVSWNWHVLCSKAFDTTFNCHEFNIINCLHITYNQQATTFFHQHKNSFYLISSPEFLIKREIALINKDSIDTHRHLTHWKLRKILIFCFCIFKRFVTGKVIALNINLTHEWWRFLMGKLCHFHLLHLVSLTHWPSHKSGMKLQ